MLRSVLRKAAGASRPVGRVLRQLSSASSSSSSSSPPALQLRRLLAPPFQNPLLCCSRPGARGPALLPRAGFRYASTLSSKDDEEEEASTQQDAVLSPPSSPVSDSQGLDTFDTAGLVYRADLRNYFRGASLSAVSSLAYWVYFSAAGDPGDLNPVVEALYSARAVPILLSGLFVAACQFFSTHFVHEVRLFDPRGAIGRPVGPHTLVHVTPHTMVDFGTPIVVPLGETVLTKQASDEARLVSIQLGKERVIRYLVDSKVCVPLACISATCSGRGSYLGMLRPRVVPSIIAGAENPLLKGGKYFNGFTREDFLSLFASHGRDLQVATGRAALGQAASTHSATATPELGPRHLKRKKTRRKKNASKSTR